MYLLDTDCMSLLGHRDRGSPALQARLARVDVAEVVTSVVSYEEQLRGWLAYIARLRSIDEQSKAYGRLLMMLRLYCATTVLPFDRPAAQEYARLRRLCPRLGSMDLKIAAIAVTHGATVITCNVRDFRQVPGLTCEDWTL